MKRVFSSLLAVFVVWIWFAIPATAQEVPDPCNQYQNEEIEQLEQDVLDDEICEEENPGTNLRKGEVSSETVAGTDAELANSPEVLGATTEEDPEVLAETGVSSVLALPLGFFTIISPVLLSGLASYKYKK